MAVASKDAKSGWLASLLSDDNYLPREPRSLEETGLSPTIIESLILKYLLAVGSNHGRGIAEKVCLPFALLDGLFTSLRRRQLIVNSASAQLGDYTYTLSEEGRARAKSYAESCSYVGAAPVPLVDYVMSVEAQTIRAEAPKKQNLIDAFKGLSVETEMLERLGPAVNSGAGLFMYGAPGNGKTTLAKRITACFGQAIWIPQTVVEDGQLVKLFDASVHEVIESNENSLLKTATHDHRWIKIRRPTVIAGGELTMDNLELRHDIHNNICEAPLQLKANCGSFLIDDFGRQRMQPQELLNRWIVPLESRVDFLTLPTGKKIQIPFEQLIIFSTNLDPKQLTDDAFLRRIPYKIEVGDPTPQEFHQLFKMFAKSFDCEYRREAVEYLIAKHYRAVNRPLRRCQPRDLLLQIRNYSTYNELPMEMSEANFDRVVRNYFTVVAGS